MAQNKFLGTIGWIKSNLMTNSSLNGKYNNQNFYPGSPDIANSTTYVENGILYTKGTVVDNTLQVEGQVDFSNTLTIKGGL